VEIPEGNGRERRVVKEDEVREEREKSVLRAAYANRSSKMASIGGLVANWLLTVNYGTHYLVSTPSRTARPAALTIPTTPSSRNSARYKIQLPL